MRLAKVSLEDVKRGLAWRIDPPLRTWSADGLESQAELQPATKFSSSDQVVYSALIAFPSGRVKALLLAKKVGDSAYGGLYWEWAKDRWTQLGLEPDPNFEIGGREFVGSPLPNDPSFDTPDDDFRAHNRKGFLQYADKLE